MAPFILKKNKNYYFCKTCRYYLRKDKMVDHESEIKHVTLYDDKSNSIYDFNFIVVFYLIQK